jgi:hypothetical protein
MFRLCCNGQEPIVDVDTLEEIELDIRCAEPRRDHIDEITRDPLPSGHTSRRWGVGSKWADGTVVIERNPCP